jgi:hypothetical protein
VKEKKVKPSVWEAIKAIIDVPPKNLKRKSVVVESSDSESIQVTPKPKKNQKLKAPTLAERSDDDVPAPPKRRAVKPALTDKGDLKAATLAERSDDNLPAPPKRRAVKRALTEKGDDTEEDLPPKKVAKKNKGKGKAIPQHDNKGKATPDKDADQTRDGNVPKAKMSVLIVLSYV